MAHKPPHGWKRIVGHNLADFATGAVVCLIVIFGLWLAAKL